MMPTSPRSSPNPPRTRGTAKHVCFIQVCLKNKVLQNNTLKDYVFPYVWPWLPELAMFDLRIGFLIKNCVYFTPGMYGKPPKHWFFHGVSKAGFGHAALLTKKLQPDALHNNSKTKMVIVQKNSKPDYSKTVMGGQKAPLFVLFCCCAPVYTRDSPGETRWS